LHFRPDGASLLLRRKPEESRVTPYSEEQRRLFNAAAHDSKIAREHGMSTREAGKLADEANKLKKQGREKPAAKAIDLTLILGQPPR